MKHHHETELIMYLWCQSSFWMFMLGESFHFTFFLWLEAAVLFPDSRPLPRHMMSAGWRCDEARVCMED